jgi:hypothetical protein
LKQTTKIKESDIDGIINNESIFGPVTANMIEDKAGWIGA